MIRLALVRRVSARPVAQAFHRSQFSSTPRRQSSLGNAITIGLVAGLVGSGTIFAAGYAAYYFSGAKRAVDTFRPAMAFLRQTDLDLAKKAPIQALHHLRQAAKAYVAYLPGAGFFVDRAFDVADDVVAAHAEEATTIISQAYRDILQVVQQGENEHKTGAALQIVSIARHSLNELKTLGAKAGKPISDQLGLEQKAGAVRSAAQLLYQEVATKVPGVFERLKEKNVIPPKSEKEEPSQSGRNSTN